MFIRLNYAKLSKQKRCNNGKEFGFSWYLPDLEKNAHLIWAMAWVFCFSSLEIKLHKETCETDAWGTFKMSALISLLCKYCEIHTTPCDGKK